MKFLHDNRACSEIRRPQPFRELGVARHRRPLITLICPSNSKTA
jgi:hypothetical protein